MKTLFLRILILCWITNAVVIAAFALAVSQLDLFPKHQGDFGFPGGHALIAGQTAVAFLDDASADAFKQSLENAEQTTRSRIFVLNDDDQDLLGRRLPAEAVNVVKRVREGKRAIPTSPGHEPWFANYARSRSGKGYVVVGTLRPSPDPPPFLIPGPLVMPMLGVVVTAGAIAFVLAYYVTAPVRKLRTATQMFAAGDLEARVGPSVARRTDVIGDLGREFNVMATQVQSLVTAQQRLLRDVSHELRSPLARLHLALGIASRNAGPQATEALNRIEHEANQLNELIGQLLTLTRLEAPQTQTKGSPINLTALVADIAEDADFEAKERSCNVKLKTSSECVVHGDEALLRSAIENVLRNAVAHTEIGTCVDVTIGQKTNGKENLALVSIRDHGPGVPEKHIASIFDPFYRVEDARDRDRGGVGLGLAIAARAARIHDGNIHARNASDGGLIVEFQVPMRPPNLNSE